MLMLDLVDRYTAGENDECRRGCFCGQSPDECPLGNISIDNNTLIFTAYYRVSQQVSDLGWVDFDVGVPLIIPTCFAHSAYLFKQDPADSGIAKF